MCDKNFNLFALQNSGNRNICVFLFMPVGTGTNLFSYFILILFRLSRLSVLDAGRFFSLLCKISISDPGSFCPEANFWDIIYATLVRPSSAKFTLTLKLHPFQRCGAGAGHSRGFSRWSQS